MKTLRVIGLVLLAVMTLSLVKAQSVQDGLRALEIQKMETAKRIFQSLIKSEPQNAAHQYYLGMAYIGTSKADSAKIAFTKGLASNANEPLNYVGMGRLALDKNDMPGVKTNFDKALSLASKNSNVYIQMADAYINAEYSDFNKAIQLLTKAKDYDKNNPKIFVLLGDAYVELLDGGNALNNYEKAMEINKNYPLANLKMGETLVRIKNNEEALKSFQNVLKLDSLYAPAYKDLADLYFQMGQYQKAKDAISKYVELSENNIASRIQKAKLLYVAKDYQGAVNEINNVLKTDTTNNVIYRILAYSLYETNNYDAGIAAIQKFFAKSNEKKILTTDYEYYGKLLSKVNQDSLAIEKIKLALKKDSTKADLYATLGDILSKVKKYKEAAEAYNFKIKNSRKSSIQEYHKMGLAYYYSNDFAKGDSAFAKVVTASPTFPGGYLWRAKCNEQLDANSSQGLAKPFYEKFIELTVSDPAKYKTDLINAYKYLGSYYYLQAKDNATSKTYWLKVKELDPADKQANDVLKALK